MEKSERGELDEKIVASFVDRNTRLLKELADSIALLQERVDVMSRR